MTEPYAQESTGVHGGIKAESILVHLAGCSIPPMTGEGLGKRRRDAPSVQLQRFRWLILQMEHTGHPEWTGDDGKPLRKVSNAELARRTGLTTSYLNAIKHPERSRNTDIGAAIIAQMCDRVGLSERYFFEKYKEERPFQLYLLSAKRDERRIDGIAAAQQDLRAEFAQFRREYAEERAMHAREVERLEKELAEARANIRR